MIYNALTVRSDRPPRVREHLVRLQVASNKQ